MPKKTAKKTAPPADSPLKRGFQNLIFLALGAAGGIIGAQLLGLPGSPATVTVVNGSSGPIKEILLSHERGSYVLYDLAVAGTVSIPLPTTDGGASYELTATLKNGTKLSHTEEVISSNTRIRHNVLDMGIARN